MKTISQNKIHGFNVGVNFSNPYKKGQTSMQMVGGCVVKIMIFSHYLLDFEFGQPLFKKIFLFYKIFQ